MPKNFTPPLVEDTTFSQETILTLFQVTVYLFGLPITLWVIGWTELQKSAHKVPQFYLEVAGKPGVPVTNHFMRNTKNQH